MSVPNHLLYTKDHEWIEFKDEYAIVGITDYAQSQLGDVIFVEFPEIGEDLHSGSSFGEVEAVKTVADLFAPISGKVLSVNEQIEDAPDLINSDPYKNGWLIKIDPNNLGEKDQLMNHLSYEKLVG